MSRSRRGSRKRSSQKTELGGAFWGTEPEREPGPIHVSADPSAMIRSLGPPPLKGHEVAAEYTFRLLFDKAAALAATLAAAAELDGDDETTEDTTT